jgi:PAS domain S-box-containing protein
LSSNYEDMSREELVERLRLLQGDSRRQQSLVEAERLLHELQVHQLELEMQNRELREAQQQLEESRGRYADLFDHAPIGYCTLDASARIQEANLAATELFGLDREHLIGRSLAAMVSPGSEDAWRQHLHACLSERAHATHEIAFSIRGRGPVTMRVMSAPAEREGVAAGGCRTTLADISAGKEAENMLRFLAEASAALSSSLEYSATLVVVVRLAVPVLADVCCVDIVESAGEIQRLEVVFTGDERRELAERLKRSVPDVQGDSAQAHVLRSGYPLLLTDPERSSVVLSDAERDCHAASIMCVPLISRGRTFGALTFMMTDSRRRYSAKELALAEDIARRSAMAIDNAQLYRSAREATKARDHILEMVSHDLRNPLNGIMMASQAAHSIPADQEQLMRLFTQITRAGSQMSRMIDDLVDVSSIDAGRFYVDREEHALAELIDESVHFFAPEAEQRGQRLTVETFDAGLHVCCDRGRVLQILANLIGNAIKFTPSGGSIVLRVTRTKDEAHVSVTDTGSGIPAARLPRLFDRYYQADETASLGRGLGLYISRRLVEAQRGTIWAESVQGAGSTFTFTLPLVAADRAGDATEPRERGSSVHEKASATFERPRALQRIMIIDDESDVREAMSGVLQEHGYAVVQAANGIEALEYLNSDHPAPAAMFVDVHMPAMDGPRLISELQRNERRKRIPVVLISSASSTELERLVGYLGVVTCLRKPIQSESLLKVVRRICGQGTLRHGIG